MKVIVRYCFVLSYLVFLCSTAFAQSDVGGLTGNFQVDVQSYREDSVIGAQRVPENVRSNAFLNLIYSKDNFSAGIRYESYLKEILGFDQAWGGSNGNAGIPFRYIRYANDLFEVTVGNYYEQFGNGTVLRAYEERGLGLDNALDGVKIKLYPVKGVKFTGLVGRQRSYFSLGPGLVRGGDLDVGVNDLLELLFDSPGGQGWQLRLGGSFAGTYERDPGGEYILPENVGAWSARFNLNVKDVTLQGEYSEKGQNPTSNNILFSPTGLNYNRGKVLFFSGSYATTGLGVTLGYKAVDNFDWRSGRDSKFFNQIMTFMPALTKQYTYRLLTLYPYATQINGETAVQADVIYTFEKNTFLGGKYGTTINFNYSRVHSPDTTRRDLNTYDVKFGAFGKRRYFEDINFELQRKWSKEIKTTFGVMSQYYDKEVALGIPGDGAVQSLIFVSELLYQMTPTNAIRFEFQHLSARHFAINKSGEEIFDENGNSIKPNLDNNNGNWVYALAEYSIAPHWFFSVFDEYNYGNDFESSRVHYYSGNIVYATGGTRIQGGYGRVRGGVLCVGGVCRNVPASNGFSLSVSSTF